MSQKPASTGMHNEWFTTTHWTTVLLAGNHSSTALEKLCRSYWYPLYGYIRRQGYDVHEAQDLTQGFFERLLGKHHLRSVHPTKGKFRSFLLTGVNHFLINERERALASKRSSGQPAFSLDDDSAENRYQMEPASDLSPDKLFERRWAMTLLDQAFNLLQAEFLNERKASLFEALKPFLSGEAEPGDYNDIAARLEMKPGAVSVAVHRLRQRYREIVREEVAHTVTRPDEIDEELRYLLSLIRG